MNPTELLLPPASRLVHIGPHKTGTTSLQRAFHTGRNKLSPHGVHFAGPTEQPLLAALAVAGGGGMKGDRPPRPEDWTELVDEVRDAGDQRVLVSSEFLCYADDAAARRVVTEISGGPVHVVVTLRPIAKIAPSQWQQYVQNGNKVAYVEWLDGMFRRPPYDKPTPSFWRRHSHGELVQRWANAVGPENLTVVVADESDPDVLLRTFEGFLGLPDGCLKASKSSSNRSLTRGEIELVREINKYFYKRNWADPWTEELHARAVRHGVVRRMKIGRSPAPHEPRLAMPEWAAERAAEVGARTVETIKSLGVRVVGELATLAEVPADRRGDEAELKRMATLPAEALSLAVLGAINAEGDRHEGAETAGVLAVLGAMYAPKAQRRADDLGPALAMLDAVNVADPGNADLSVLPPVRVDAAARVALGVIGAAASQSEPTEAVRIPAYAAWLAVLGATRGAREIKKKVAKPKSIPMRELPIEKRTVEKVRAPDLLRAVARRVRRRVGRRIRGR